MTKRATITTRRPTDMRARMSTGRLVRSAGLVRVSVGVGVGMMLALGAAAPAAFGQVDGQPISKQATPPAVPEPKLVEPKDPNAPPEQAPPVEMEVVDGPGVKVGRFVISYRFAHPQAPAIEDLLNTEVELGQTPEGYVKARPGVPSVMVRLADVPDRPIELYRLSGIEAVTDAIRDQLGKFNVLGVVVRVVPNQVNLRASPDDPDFGKDLRTDTTDLRIEVIMALASQVRTLAFGDRVKPEFRVNNPIYDRIREGSPIQPAEDMDDPDRSDLILKNRLDDYIYRLNRHSGRKVNAALSIGDDKKSPTGEQLPTVSLDYLVIENKPWLLYFQLSNTGTDATGEWRERVGFIHNQLTGRDDTLSLDFITSNFEDSNAFIGSYEAPFPGADKLRWRVFGTWNEFTADDVGQGSQTRDFDGDGWSAGGELIANIYQHRELFVDLVGGVKWQHVRVEDKSAGGSEGEDDFFLPYFGLRLERETDIATTYASVNFEFNLPDLASTSSDLDALGRPLADDSWTAFQWDVTQSLYLEPLLIPTAWRDTANGRPTLAHELLVSFKGQYAFDNRLIPSFEQVAGGLYSVRGYKESATAGDGVMIGSAEYRFHVPKAFTSGYRVREDGTHAQPGQLFGKPFNWVPSQPYGSADWDLILKSFLDVGRTIISDIPGAEDEETLIGAGVGFEFQYKSNFSLRVDWGVALKDVESAEIKAGSNRFHFLATFLF